MKMKALFKNKIRAVLVTFILTLIIVLLEYFNGGVAKHHLLARQDLPGISNWWGLLTIPLLTWIMVSLIAKQRANKVKLDQNQEGFDSKVQKQFLISLSFGIIASILWELKFADFLQYYILLPFLIAFFKPIYYPEYLLGFVIGMLFTFGGILPIIFGSVILILCFLIFKIVQILKKLILSKPKKSE